MHRLATRSRGILLSLAAAAALAACHESPSSDENCGYYSGPGFDDIWVCYDVDGDLAVLGDIILGAHEEMQQKIKPRIAIGGHDYYWPKARVPYTIAADVPQALRTRITESIADYHANTPLRFVPKERRDDDYVEFVMAPAGAGFRGRSWLGRIGGRQELELNPNLVGDANAGHTVRHEMGHAVGLTHEQVRPDRDDWVRVDLSLLPASWRSKRRSSITHHRARSSTSSSRATRMGGSRSSARSRRGASNTRGRTAAGRRG